MLRSTHVIVASALVALVTTGCGTKVTIPAWQKAVNTYVANTGRGDPNVLRDVTLPGTDRRGFAIIGHHDPDRSTDANGVLLAHRDAAGRPWFVYLVGLVKEEKFKEIRLAAMSDTGSKPVWRVGQRNKDAERAYRDYNLAQFRERFPDRKQPPAEYLGFPRAADTFDLTDDGNGLLTATHKPSGARWELDLSSQNR
jgi:hypothetical protein